LKIFVGQIKSVAGDTKGNLARIKATYQKAINESCDICLLPELVTSGYLAEDLFFNPDFIDEINDINKKLIAESKKCSLILPTIIKDKENLYSERKTSGVNPRM
jgi:predicted amidohydrolase